MWLRFWRWLRTQIAVFLRAVSNAITHPRFAKIAVEFFTEAAVLVFVFPILDTIIERGGMAKVTWSLVMWSLGIALLFVILAGIIAMQTEE